LPPSDRPRSPRQWLLPLLALAIGVLGMTAAWLALAVALQGPHGWLAPLAALDMALMLRLSAAPAGRVRAALAVLGTVAAIAVSYWMICATLMANLMGLSPLESALRMGPVLAGELARHMTSGWDIAWAVLAVVLAWRLGR
jgi:glucan phosphoethanolaminetransferase (alkaline phosphatase superfamily)